MATTGKTSVVWLWGLMRLPFKNRFQAAHELLDEYSGDGYTRGHAEQVVGHLFIAEGRRMSRRGIHIALAGLGAAGINLASIIYSVQQTFSNMPANGVTTQGTVGWVVRGGPRSSCNVIADYIVNGVHYQTSGNNGAWWQCRQSIGQSVVVTYDALHPATGAINLPRDWQSWENAYLISAALLLLLLVTLIRHSAEPLVGRLLVRHGQRLIRRHPAAPVDQMMAEVKERFEQVLHPLWKDGRLFPPPLGKAFDENPPPYENAAPGATPAPGWYTEPTGADGPALERWDGTRWTGERILP